MLIQKRDRVIKKLPHVRQLADRGDFSFVKNHSLIFKIGLSVSNLSRKSAMPLVVEIRLRDCPSRLGLAEAEKTRGEPEHSGVWLILQTWA